MHKSYLSMDFSSGLQKEVSLETQKRSPAAEQRAVFVRSPQSLQGSCSPEMEHGALLPQHLPGHSAPREAPKAPGRAA